MEIGIQTKGLFRKEYDIDLACKKIAAAGFTRIDYNLDAFLLNAEVKKGEINDFFDASREELAELFMHYRQEMDKYGIRPSQMHSPYPVYLEGKEEISNYMSQNVIPKSFMIAKILGVPWMVLHPTKLQYTKGKSAEIKKNIEYYSSLIPIIKETGVRVCFENLYDGIGKRIVEGVCADPNEVIYYIDTLNEMAGEELFGTCLDTGHLMLVHRDPYEYIKALGSRIKLLHIHENDAVDDLHQIPYTFGNGDENSFWEGFYLGLRETGFDGTLSFETYPVINSFPKNCQEMVLETIYGVGVYMRERIRA